MVPVVTIDGPSGSGKGTIGQRLANRLGWRFLDSGALYRLLGLTALRCGTALHAEAEVAALAASLDIRFDIGADGSSSKVFLGGDEVTEAIRTQECSQAASQVAALAEVRDALLAWQRAYRQPPGLVADGRDMGTVVFPTAQVKIYLDATAEERTRRRYKQLIEKGFDVKLPLLLEEMCERDRRDRSRIVAPLKPALDALIVDTSVMTIDEVLERVVSEIRRRLPAALGSPQA